MKHAIESAFFKPMPPKAESKADITTRVSRQIVEGEAAANAAKTQRLRAARLAQEVSGIAVAAPRKAQGSDSQYLPLPNKNSPAP